MAVSEMNSIRLEHVRCLSLTKSSHTEMVRTCKEEGQ